LGHFSCTPVHAAVFLKKIFESRSAHAFCDCVLQSQHPLALDLTVLLLGGCINYDPEQDAASIAGLLITTEAMVAEVPKKQSSAPAMPGGGMGGMDY